MAVRYVSMCGSMICFSTSLCDVWVLFYQASLLQIATIISAHITL